MSDDVKKYIELGNYEFICENFTGAYDYYKRGIEIDPDNAYLWYKRSLSALRLNNLSEFSIGFEKARSLADADFYSEIESTFILEMILLNWEMLETKYQDACRGSGLGSIASRSKKRLDIFEEIDKILDRIFFMRNKLRIDNKNLLISDSHAIDVMKKIYKVLMDIEQLRGALEYEIFWRKKVGTNVVSCIDNTALWLNAKIGKNEFDGLASLIIMAQRRLS